MNNKIPPYPCHPEPRNPYRTESDVVDAIRRARHRYIREKAQFTGKTEPNVLFLGYYEKDALERYARRHLDLRCVHPELMQRSEWEGMQILTVDAYSYCQVDFHETAN